METAEFHYDLPARLIAQHPSPDRAGSRLLVLNRSSKTIEHRRFPDLLEYLHPGDLLVVNNSKVIPARLFGKKVGTGGEVEMLLYKQAATNDWWAMARPAKRLREGSLVEISEHSGKSAGIFAEVLSKNDEGHVRFAFKNVENIAAELDRVGQLPLPPYIQRTGGNEADDLHRYQTVYSKEPGSVAAPTAGLHFTPELLQLITLKGVEITEVTLHVGLGTFAPVKAANLSEHKMHREEYEISPEAANAVNFAKANGKRVIAVGTTSTRVLESAADDGPPIKAGKGATAKFIYPPYKFKVADALVTNFHLPESTLLMLVSAFAQPASLAGKELILDAYRQAIKLEYRFFSYGDAMFIHS